MRDAEGASGAKLGEAWKALPEEETKKYQDLAEKAREEYKIAIAQYEEDNPGAVETTKKSAPKSKATKGDTKEAASKAEASKKSEKDPNAPKKPQTSFVVFCA
eukprot:3083705-Rhodomonas_salina.1